MIEGVGAEIHTVASSLEPLAGASLALNLAYLGLTRFRYREQIRTAAEFELKIFEPSDKPAPDNIKSMKYYGHIRNLCSLSNHDIADIPGAEKAAKIDGARWSDVYNILYRKHFDRYTVYFAALIAGLTLIAGVAETLKVWNALTYLYPSSIGVYWLIGLIVASLLPVVFVIMGRRVVHYTCCYAKECRVEIEKAMQTSTAKASFPNDIEQTNQNIVTIG